MANSTVIDFNNIIQTLVTFDFITEVLDTYITDTISNGYITSIVSNNYVTAIMDYRPAANLGSVANSGSITLNAANGPLQYVSIGSSVTINTPNSDCQIELLVYNNSDASGLTMNGFGANWTATGMSFYTAAGANNIIRITRINGFSVYRFEGITPE